MTGRKHRRHVIHRPRIAIVGGGPSDIIKWNHKITTVRSNRNATTGATEITFDLGAWSRIRKLSPSTAARST
jgi:hypothetical protein